MSDRGDWDDELPSDEELEAAVAPDELPTEGEGSLAGVGQRALGRFVDAFIAFNVGGILAFAIVRPQADDGVWEGVLFLTVIIAFAGLYETAMVTWRGQTLGKMLMGTRVARFSDGTNPLPVEAMVRFAVPTVPLYVPYIGQFVWIGVYLSAIPNERKQGFHDKAAGTVVVRTR